MFQNFDYKVWAPACMKNKLTPTFKHQPPKKNSLYNSHPAKVLDIQARMTNGASLPVIMPVLALWKSFFPGIPPDPGKAGLSVT